MPWVSFFLAVISGYVAAKLFGLTNKQGRLKFLGLTLAASIFTMMQIAEFAVAMNTNPSFINAVEFIVEWGHVTCLAFVLSSMAVFIRESKPVFAQFPMPYTALPLLIVLSYILVHDTYALKTWLIAIYQGGAITVSLLMYSVYTYRDDQYKVILSGIILFLFCYILYWYIPGVSDSYAWIWKILIGAGMITTLLGYEQIEVKAPSKTL